MAEKYTGVLIKCPRCKHWGATVTKADGGYWQATCENRQCQDMWISAAHGRINRHIYGTKHRPVRG